MCWDDPRHPGMGGDDTHAGSLGTGKGWTWYWLLISICGSSGAGGGTGWGGGSCWGCCCSWAKMIGCRVKQNYQLSISSTYQVNIFKKELIKIKNMFLSNLR